MARSTKPSEPRIGLGREDAPPTFDPVRYCVFTTIAVIAWIVTPPAAVLWTSSLGLWAYARAWRAGVRRSRCVLGDVRLVVAYLGIAWIAGAVFTAQALFGRFG